MLTVTETALNQLNEYFADKDAQPIRIYLTSGGCSGPRLMLGLDEPGEGDAVMTSGGFTFVMDAEMFKQAEPLTIDMGPAGFTIDSQLELGGGGCSPGDCCSSGGSCSC